MNIETIALLWGKKHEGGKVWRKGGRTFGVTYGPTPSKVYTYKANNLRDLGERLGLIDPVDVGQSAIDAIEALKADGVCVTYTVCADSIRYHWQREGDDRIILTEETDETDVWGRSLTVYRLGNRSDDPWLQ